MEEVLSPLPIISSHTCLAIQFAKLSGFSPIITTASLRNADLLKSLGATHVVDRTSTSVVSDILKTLDQVRPSIVVDAVSEKETQKTAWEVLAPGGILSIMLPQTVGTEKEPKKHVYWVVGSPHLPNLRDFGYVMYTHLPRLLEEGKLKVTCSESM